MCGWLGRFESIAQVNFLADLRKHFPTHNGYVVLTGREPSFPKVGSAKYDRLFGKVLVGYHHNAQVCPPRVGVVFAQTTFSSNFVMCGVACACACACVR
jgi:hypothetical protein